VIFFELCFLRPASFEPDGAQAWEGEVAQPGASPSDGYSLPRANDAHGNSANR